MQIDEEYLESLLNSIEPIVNPDGIQDKEQEEDREFFEEELTDAVAEPLEPVFEEKTSDSGTDANAVSDSAPIDAKKQSDADSDAVADELSPMYNESDAVKELLQTDNESAGVEKLLQADNDAEAIEELLQADSEPLSEDILSEAEAALPEELAFSLSEIDAMLEAAKDTDNEADGTSLEGSDEDLLALLAESGDEDLDAIQSLLKADEAGEAVDEAAVAAATNIEDVAANILEESDNSQTDKKKKKGFSFGKKKKDAAEENSGDENDGNEAKSGIKEFFTRIINILTEPMDDEDKELSEEASLTGISAENEEILEELDKEKGKKKGKKEKKKKDNSKEAKNESDDEEEEGENASSDKKKKKKEKKPKVKTVREEEPSKPEKKLPKKKVRVAFLLCFSIMAAIIVAVFGLTKIINLKDARWAFDNQDYKTAYENLYGLKLGEADALIYNKSRTILAMDRKYESYKNYSRLGMGEEALNALLEGIRIYPEVQEAARQYGVESQVDYTYSEIINALSDYGLSTEDALEIIGYDSEVKYNKRIYSIVHNTPFDYNNENYDEEYTDAEQKKLVVSDILPEEKDFLPDNPDSIFEGTDENITPDENTDVDAATVNDENIEENQENAIEE